MKQRILVIADDAALRASLARWLIAAGYMVELAEGARRAREVADRVALAILAVDGLGEADPDLAPDLARSIGRLMIVAEHAETLERWTASPLATGGCLQVPLNEQELLARVAAALPAAASTEAPDAGEVLQVAGITLDVAARTCVGPGGQNIALTPAEFSLLVALARRPDKVQSRNELQRAVTGRDPEPDDRTVDVLVSRLRRKIEHDPKEPRLIITVPGEGYRLSAAPPAETAAVDAGPDAAPAPRSAAAAQPDPATAAGVPSPTMPGPPRAPFAALRRRPILWSAAAVALIAAVVVLLWYPAIATRNQYSLAVAKPKFDAGVVPFVTDLDRESLASYPAHPDAKAVAISADGLGVAFGTADIESARREALERCSVRARTLKVCRIYAVGMEVVWNAASVLPLPADIHGELLDEPLVTADVPTLDEDNRERLAAALKLHHDHQALAIVKGTWFRMFDWETRAEAVRLTVQRCSDLARTPCLLLSVDGKLTVRIPRSQRIVDVFMLTNDPALSDQDRARIAQIYRQKSWRALARGRSGGWYAIANAPSEAAAVDGAFAACVRADSDCRIYAIENFRVTDQSLAARSPRVDRRLDLKPGYEVGTRFP